MKKNHKAIAASVSMLALASTSSTAAEITWQAPVTMTGDSDVSINGESRVAINAGGLLSYTVNGVLFESLPNPPSVPILLPFQTTINRSTEQAYGRGSLPGTFVDEIDDLGDLVESGYFGSTAPSTVTFTELLNGQEYEIQIFLNDARDTRDINWICELGDGLQTDPPNFTATFQLNNSPVGGEATPEMPEQGDYIIGTFTADAATQSFFQTGSLDGGVSINAGRIQINAIQLRAIGNIIEPPMAEESFWTGLDNGNLDLSSSNFTLNEPAAGLSQGSLADVNANEADVILGDTYTADGSDIAVATSTLTIPANAQPTAAQFSFRNSAAVPYSVESSDEFGISGVDTALTAEGDGSLTLFGTHSYTGLTIITPGYTLNMGDAANTATLTASPVIAEGNVIYDTTSGDVSVPTALQGGGSFTKLGDNSLTIEVDSVFNGTTALTAGTLVTNGLFASSAVEIAAGAVLEMNALTSERRASVAYSGDGTFVFNGEPGTITNFAVGTFQFGADALIDVRSGELRGGSNANENWTANASDLNIEAGALFTTIESNVRIDELTGTGDFSTGFDGAGYIEATIGVGNGTATFDGAILNGTGGQTGNIRKAGTGTQTLTGFNQYSGNTTIEDGGFVIEDTSTLSFFPLGNTISNSISGDPTTGTGSLVFDGALLIDDFGTDLTEGNFWTLIDPTNLASVTLGENFRVVDFSENEYEETSPGIWEIEAFGGVDVTFEEATFTLFVGDPFPLPMPAGPGIPVSLVEFNDAGELEVTATDLDAAATYQLRRANDGLTDFTTDIGAPFTGVDSNTFVDPTPPAEQAFYRVFELEPAVVVDP